MLKTNYHTHLSFCGHAEGLSDDYVKEAIKLNMDEIGISDHAPIPDGIMSEEEYIHNYCHENMKYDTFINEYIPDVLNARKNNPNIKVLLALETEYIEECLPFYEDLRSKVDYLILGVHFFKRDNKIVCVYDKMNSKDIIDYALAVEKALNTGLFAYLAHPDLFMYNYSSTDGMYVFDEYCKKASEIIINACIKNNCLIEINAGGTRRKVKLADKEVYRYTRNEFFEIAKKYNAKFILGADAHEVSHLSDDSIKNIKNLKEELEIDVITYME